MPSMVENTVKPHKKAYYVFAVIQFNIYVFIGVRQRYSYVFESDGMHS